MTWRLLHDVRDQAQFIQSLYGGTGTWHIHIHSGDFPDRVEILVISHSDRSSTGENHSTQMVSVRFCQAEQQKVQSRVLRVFQVELLASLKLTNM